ncbi:bacteriorhodopsin, partial [Deinococcus murrayi]|uniref:bacteriorhodopsin n=1 Tax=Deinococcus murrayi TaxID=68910 RepID=UPI00146FA852
MDPNLERTLHWVYVACMAAGVLYFWFLSRDPRGVPRYEYLTALMIALVSGTVYMAVALGYGKTVVGGTEVYYARYLDWVVTTPLLLLALAWTAMYRSSHKADYSSKRVTGSRKSAPVRCFCDENPWEPTPPR